MPDPQLLVVDDDEPTRELLDAILRKEGYGVVEADSTRSALELARATDPDLVLSDIVMPGGSGIDFARTLRGLRPEVPVVMMTGFATIETLRELMRVGAFDYIAKPFDPDDVRLTVKRALDARAPCQIDLPRCDDLGDFSKLVDVSRPMREVVERVQRAAQVDASVLITGETGTGKELVARALHACGTRAGKPLIAVNCTAIPEGLLESELFGHVKGAFTGATANRCGLFEQANGGTLFLDEIGDLGAGLQAKLLRVLQEGELRPVGAREAVRVDVRVVAATHRDLAAAMDAGAFREDLFYRLAAIPIHLAPLRDRPEDIPSLVAAFVRRHAGGQSRRFTQTAIRALQERSWPGNVRELENLVARTLAMSDSPLIGESELPLFDAGRRSRNDEAFERGLAEAASNGLTLRELADSYIDEVLARTGGKKGEAAQRLGIDRKTLYRRATAER